MEQVSSQGGWLCLVSPKQPLRAWAPKGHRRPGLALTNSILMS